MRLLVACIAVLSVVACGGDDRTEADLMSYTVLGPRQVQVMVDGCDADPAVTFLEETATEVRLTVHRDPVEPWLGRGNCAGGVRLDLNKPLGDRRIVRAASGVAVPVARG